jgi:hypothetical protein
MTAVLQSAETTQHINDLAANPIIIEMETEIPANVDLTTWEFMQNARAEASDRGVVSNIIGGVAMAIQKIRENR